MVGFPLVCWQAAGNGLVCQWDFFFNLSDCQMAVCCWWLQWQHCFPHPGCCQQGAYIYHCITNLQRSRVVVVIISIRQSLTFLLSFSISVVYKCMTNNWQSGQTQNLQCGIIHDIETVESVFITCTLIFIHMDWADSIKEASVICTNLSAQRWVSFIQYICSVTIVVLSFNDMELLLKKNIFDSNHPFI